MAAAGIPDSGNKGQQVQNALERLYRYNLIARQENKKKSKDGSRYVYGKEETVRAHKDEIRKYADNPRLAARVPTKREVQIVNRPPASRVTKRELNEKTHLSVLYLCANPIDKNHLRVDAEVRQVQDAVRKSKYRDNIKVSYRPAANLQTLLDGLNDFEPQIVHFSGHGNEQGVATDTGDTNEARTGTLSFEILAKAISATDSPPQVVVLNACKSSSAAKSLLPTTKILISMKESISDLAAGAFATQFYAALASGRSVQAAFDQGQVALGYASISEWDTPQLSSGPNVNPAQITLT